MNHSTSGANLKKFKQRKKARKEAKLENHKDLYKPIHMKGDLSL